MRSKRQTAWETAARCATLAQEADHIASVVWNPLLSPAPSGAFSFRSRLRKSRLQMPVWLKPSTTTTSAGR
jgi:hypothetical protein